MSICVDKLCEAVLHNIVVSPSEEAPWEALHELKLAPVSDWIMLAIAGIRLPSRSLSLTSMGMALFTTRDAGIIELSVLNPASKSLRDVIGHDADRMA